MNQQPIIQKQRKLSQKRQKKQINNITQQQPQQQQPQQQPQQIQKQKQQQQRIKLKKQSISQKSNRTVNFNLKKNFVEKFYCPEMAIANLTKSDPIDLGSIQDLPEIPLDSLFGTR